MKGNRSNMTTKATKPDEPKAPKALAEDDAEVDIPITIHVTDKRRVSSEGELIGEPESEASEIDAAAVGLEIEMLQTRLKESEEKLVEAERQVKDFAERFRSAQSQLRLEADEQRARMQRTFDQKLETARGDLIAGLLETLDNLKRAVQAAEKAEKRETDFDALLEGVRATAQLFEAKMQAMGLSAVISEGEDFNPEVHEAVEIVQVPKEQDNKVIQEYQTGYKFGDRLLRPARVRVGRAG